MRWGDYRAGYREDGLEKAQRGGMLADEVEPFSSKVHFLRGPCFPARPAAADLTCSGDGDGGASPGTPEQGLMPVLQAISASMNEEPVVSLSAVLFICLFGFLK